MLHRTVNAIVGLLIGALLGMLSVRCMLVAGSNFGLDNVRPGAAFGHSRWAGDWFAVL